MMFTLPMKMLLIDHSFSSIILNFSIDISKKNFDNCNKWKLIFQDKKLFTTNQQQKVEGGSNDGKIFFL